PQEDRDEHEHEPDCGQRDRHDCVQRLRPVPPGERLTQRPGDHTRHCSVQVSRRTSTQPPTARATAAYRLSTASPVHGDSVPSSLLVVLSEFPTIRTGTYVCS